MNSYNSLPALSDYRDALRNPQVCFKDHELRQSSFIPTRRTASYPPNMQMPLTYPGNFALAAAFTSPDGQQWAVRCFHRPLPGDIVYRYAAISEFIQEQNTDLLAPIEFQPEGILVNGTWYPICKMVWVPGDPLDKYLEIHAQDTSAIVELALNFRLLVTELEKLGCAHGDLQHGNILVQNRRPYLVDYDGMYVPALQGYRASESGHRHYQHPQRIQKPEFFDARLDRFSAITIYLSLMAIAAHGKWYNPDDEAIFLRENSYLIPDDLQQIRRLEDIGMAPAAHHLRSICKGNLEDVPSLDEFITNTGLSWYRPYDVVVDEEAGDSMDVASLQKEVSDFEPIASLPSSTTGQKISSQQKDLHQYNTGVIILRSLTLYEKPTAESSALVIVEQNSELTVVQIYKDFLFVEYEGHKGWVFRSQVQFRDKNLALKAAGAPLASATKIDTPAEEKTVPDKQTSPQQQSDKMSPVKQGTPHQEEQKKRMAVVRIAANLYQQPFGKKVLQRLLEGKEVEVIREEKQYVYVKCDGQQGWVHCDRIRFQVAASQTEDRVTSPSEKKKTVVIANTTYLHSQPHGGKVLRRLTTGDEFEVIREDQGYIHVASYNNQKGWIHCDHVIFKEATSRTGNRAKTPAFTPSQTRSLSTSTNTRYSNSFWISSVLIIIIVGLTAFALSSTSSDKSDKSYSARPTSTPSMTLTFTPTVTSSPTSTPTFTPSPQATSTPDADYYIDIARGYCGKVSYEDECIENLLMALELEPDNAYTWRRLGDGYRYAKDYQRSLVAYSQSIDIRPNMRAYYGRGITYRKLEMYRQAIQDFEKAIDYLSDDPGYAKYVYYEKGLAHYEYEQYKEAVVEFSFAIAEDPRDGESFYYRGSSYYNLGRYELAIEDYTKAIEFYDGDVRLSTAYIKRARTWIELGEYKSALSDYNWALETATSSSRISTVYWELGNFYYNELNTCSEASSYYRKYEDVTGSLEPFMAEIINACNN